jgi:TRAP-type C4-dicarboxylate transport system permease small subunit
MTLLHVIDKMLVKAETGFLVLFLAIMIVLSFSQVVLRNFFGTGILWGDTLVRHLVIWVGFMGAAIATHEERHISIDALTRFFSPRWKALSQILTSLFAVIVCYYLSDAALVFLNDERDSGSDLILSIPTWVALIVIPVGYGLMGIHFVVKIIENAMRLLGKEVGVKS